MKRRQKRRRRWLMLAALGGLLCEVAWWFAQREPQWTIADVSRSRG